MNSKFFHSINQVEVMKQLMLNSAFHDLWGKKRPVEKVAMFSNGRIDEIIIRIDVRCICAFVVGEIKVWGKMKSEGFEKVKDDSVPPVETVIGNSGNAGRTFLILSVSKSKGRLNTRINIGRDWFTIEPLPRKQKIRRFPITDYVLMSIVADLKWLYYFSVNPIINH